MEEGSWRRGEEEVRSGEGFVFMQFANCASKPLVGDHHIQSSCLGWVGQKVKVKEDVEVEVEILWKEDN